MTIRKFSYYINIRSYMYTFIASICFFRLVRNEMCIFLHNLSSSKFCLNCFFYSVFVGFGETCTLQQPFRNPLLFRSPSTMMASNSFVYSKGKYLLLSQFFQDVHKYNVGEDLRLSNAMASSAASLLEQELDCFDEQIVSKIAEDMMKETTKEVISDRLSFASHIIRDLSSGEDIVVVALVLGPFPEDVKNDNFWKYLAEKGNAFLPSYLTHFKLII